MNDHSSHLLNDFRTRFFESFSVITFEIDSSPSSAPFYNLWFDFLMRVITLHGFRMFDATLCQSVNRIIDRFANEANQDKAKLVFRILEVSKFDDFVKRYQPLLESIFKIPMSTIYQNYLLKLMDDFISTEGAQFKTFKNGALFDCLNTISANPVLFIPLSLYNTAELLFDR